MIKKITAAIIALMMVISFASCTNKSTDDAEFGWGTTENGHYENKYFGFSIDISPDYIYRTPQEMANLNPARDEEGNITPVDITTIEDLSAEALVHYIYATKYEIDTLQSFNPYINIFSENMQFTGNMFNKEDYVENSIMFTSMIFNDAGVGVEVLPLEKPWFDDREFAKGTMKIDYEEFTMTQEIYAITKGNYTLVIVIGYSHESERQELQAFLDTIKIK